MLRQLLVVVILYLIINQMILSFSQEKIEISNEEKIETSTELSKKNIPGVIAKVPIDLFGKPYQYEPNKLIIWVMLEPKPWTQIIYTYNEEFPFRFFLKVRVPGLNDYQAWKQLIPNLDFDSKTGEIIIPSKDEAGALAIGNLIVSNFGGQLSIETILEKNLIPISINKAQQYEMVRTKLRDQINEALQGKSIKTNSDYEKDLAKQPVSEKQTEPFKNNDPGAYEGGEFSYL
jgi:hypothetical protein